MLRPKPIFAVVVLVCVGLLAGSTQAQPAAPVPQKPAGTGAIEGKVLKDATGEPLRGARLELRLTSRTDYDDEGLEAVSDETGKFSFANLAPGIYSLSVRRTGYVTQNYGERPGASRRFGRGGTPLSLAAGQQMRDLQFRMVAGGVITGRVYDQFGDPMEGAGVMASRPGSLMASFFDNEQSAETNDLGEYRLYGLAPGEYVVLASPTGSEAGFRRMARRMAAGGQAAAGAEGVREAAGQTYYPGVTEATRASRVDVRAGQETTGIDITIRAVRVYTVRGSVTIPSGLKPDQVRLMMIRSDGAGDDGGSATANPDGSFEIPGVPSGNYMMIAMGMDPEDGGGSHYSARQEVVVGGADVEGVSIHLGGGAQVSGKLRVEGKSEIPKYSYVHLYEKEEHAFSGGGNAQVKDDGTFEMKGVAPGSYAVGANVAAGKDSYYLKEARLGGQDVRELLNVSSGGVVGLELVMGSDGGTISGRVLTEESLPSPGAQVLLIPADEKKATFDFKFEQADQLGRFLITGVRPGDYKLIALEELNPADFAGLRSGGEFMSIYKDQGSAVRVATSGQHSVDVPLTRPKK